VNWADTEPFLSYSEVQRRRHGGRTYKVVVSSQLTCPTRDGTISRGGCNFCDVRGSSSFHGKRGRGADVTTQIDSRLGPLRERFGVSCFVAYFQSYTNTYAEIPYLEEIYSAVLGHPEISGLAIGTRPDCLPDPVLALLESLTQSSGKPVTLELGVQSFVDASLEFLERGHDAACSVDAIQRTSRLAPLVEISAHLMFGMPTDPERVGRDAALCLNALPVHGAKLHQLMVLENTGLAEIYRTQPFETLTLERYATIAADFLDHLRPDLFIERLYASATHPEECLAPLWSRERWGTHNAIRKRLGELGCVQGRLVPAGA